MRRICAVLEQNELRTTLRRAFESEGYHISFVDSTMITPAWFRQTPMPDLILADVDLVSPDHDGMAVLEILRTQWREVPLMALSGVLGPMPRQTILEMGAICCLSKPLDIQMLVRIIDVTLYGGQGKRKAIMEQSPRPPAQGRHLSLPHADKPRVRWSEWRENRAANSAREPTGPRGG